MAGRIWRIFFPIDIGTHSHIEKVFGYILNQEKQHKKKSFKEEYLGFLRKFEVEYDEKYLFEWYD